MTIVHIVSFKSSGDASARQSLVEAFKALKTECVHPETKKPYIQSFKCGKQDSPEGKHRDMDFVFMMEFENDKDRDYYLDHDPAHLAFKSRVKSDFQVTDAIVLDFTEGKL